MHHSHPIIRFSPLFVILMLVLFPLGWLGTHWPALGAIINRLFATPEAHTIGHMVCFFILGLALLITFPRLHTRPDSYIGLMLVASIGQEAFQILYKQRPVVLDDVRDLVVDTVAVMLAFAVVWSWQRWQSARRSSALPGDSRG